jgi:hypothetical protein
MRSLSFSTTFEISFHPQEFQAWLLSLACVSDSESGLSFTLPANKCEYKDKDDYTLTSHQA